MIEVARAKVNLALHLRRRRDDGYHDLETLFAFTVFGDELAVEDSDRLELRIGGPMAAAIVGDDHLPAQAGADAGASVGDNLVLRAARALANAAGIRPMVALTLDKHIPVAAGLGGGSADAAATLRLLNRFWHLDWPLERLAALGATIGADVPACVFSRTLAGTGRGDLLAAVDLDLADRPILLVNPRVAVSTGPVFAGWDRIDRGPLKTSSWRQGRNDLSPAAIVLAPVIGEVLKALARTGADFVRMSGSGATCLALYADPAACAAAERTTSHDHPVWWTAATRLV